MAEGSEGATNPCRHTFVPRSLPKSGMDFGVHTAGFTWSNRSMIRVTFSILCLIASAMSAAPVAGAKPPNIVFILIDNCGKEWLGCYGSQENCTPNMDRLARAQQIATSEHDRATGPADHRGVAVRNQQPTAR